MKRVNLDISISVPVELIEDLKAKGDVNSYASELVETDLSKIVQLEQGFYYNRASKVLYNSFDKEVKLTRIEAALFGVLFENIGKIVSFDEIHRVAWKGKNMTSFTLRNKVKTLRDKTYYDLLKNHSNIGYSMEVK